MAKNGFDKNKPMSENHRLLSKLLPLRAIKYMYVYPTLNTRSHVIF